MAASENTNLETGAGEAPMAVAPATGGTVAPVAQLQSLRARVLPLLHAVKAEYAGRSAVGYPMVIDNVERSGVFGITLSPGFGLYFMTDGTSLYTELHTVQLRVDALSMANAEKFAGRPEIVREDIDDAFDLADARRLVSRLQNRWNRQQTRIYRVDS